MQDIYMMIKLKVGLGRLQWFAFMLGWRSPHLEREGNTD